LVFLVVVIVFLSLSTAHILLNCKEFFFLFSIVEEKKPTKTEKQYQSQKNFAIQFANKLNNNKLDSRNSQKKNKKRK